MTAAFGRLGFGTAAFGAAVGERARQRLLEAALESGVTHFDTAPLYGDGTAEASVGRFAAGRREAITLAAKVGLEPPPGGGVRRTARAVARRLGRATPVATRVDADGARASLERTLGRLRVEHVDLLLLHERSPGDDGFPELAEVAEEAVASGRAAAWGIAVGGDYDAARGTAVPPVVQMAGGVLAKPSRAAGATILHSVLARDLARIHAHLDRSDTGRAAWREAAGVEPTREALAPVLLRAAADASPGATILFGSREIDHVRRNAAIDAVAPEAVQALLEVAAALRGEAP